MTKQDVTEKGDDNNLAEQRAAAERIQENLRYGSDGKNFKVEEEKSVMGDRRRFKVTDKHGASTQVDITGEGKVEVRGEQKELKDAIERGEKLTNLKTGADGMSKAQQETISQINASYLSEKEKQELREKVQSHNFAEETQKPEQFSQEVQQEINQQESKHDAQKVESDNREPGNNKPISMRMKLMSLRGLADLSGDKPAAPKKDKSLLNVAMKAAMLKAKNIASK